MSSGLRGILDFVTPDLHFSPKSECLAKICGAEGRQAHFQPPEDIWRLSAGLFWRFSFGEVECSVVYWVVTWWLHRVARSSVLLSWGGPTSAVPAQFQSSAHSSVLARVTLTHAFSGGHVRWGVWTCRLTGIKHFAAGEAGLVPPPPLMTLSGWGQGYLPSAPPEASSREVF